jgi:hypothetical protein
MTIFFIAALHFLVFSRKAKDYDAVVKEYIKAKSDNESVVKQAKNPTEVKKFEEENKKYQTEFRQIVENLKIDLPQYYLDINPESIQKRRTECLQNIEKIVSLKTKLSTTKLNFLGENGWNVPLELPQEIKKRPERLWDVISQINSINRILKVIDNEVVKEEKLRQYSELLKEIGVDESKIEGLNKYGQYLPFINRLCHYRLIVKEKPKDINLTDQEIQDLLRITYPDDNLFKLNRQIFALIDLLESADQNKIEEITEVSLTNIVEIKATPKQEGQDQTAGAPAEPGATPTPTPKASPRPQEMDELTFMAGEGMDPESMQYGRGRRGPEQAAASTQEFLGYGVPILLRFNGSNLNITNYLYSVSHMPRTYELDSLMINTIKDREGVEDVYAWINIIAIVDGVLVDLDNLWKPEPKKAAAATPVPRI